jgi:HK97 family phage major capsid protein
LASGLKDVRFKSGTTYGLSEGGMLVPEEFAAELWNYSLEQEIVRPRARVWPMKSNILNVAAAVIEEHKISVSGVVCRWLGEGATAPEVDPKFRGITFQARKLAAFGSATNELLADAAISYENTLQAIYGEAFGFEMDSCFLSGTGAGQPQGVLDAPCTVVTPKEIGPQAAKTIIYENLGAMLSHLWPGSFNRAVWVVSPSTLPMLLQLTVPTGLGGTFYPILKTGVGGMTMLTRPVLVSEKMKGLGTKGDIMLTDFSQYGIGMRREIVMERSNAPGWTTDKTAFRAICRVDGGPMWDKPLIIEGGHEVSPFVVLETR